MADDKKRLREPTQVRLTPRIADMLRDRAKANGSSLTREMEGLIERGEMLERISGPQHRLAFNMLVSFSTWGAAGAVSTLLEGGADWRVIQGSLETYKMNAGITPMPKFHGDAP